VQGSSSCDTRIATRSGNNTDDHPLRRRHVNTPHWSPTSSPRGGIEESGPDQASPQSSGVILVCFQPDDNAHRGPLDAESESTDDETQDKRQNSDVSSLLLDSEGQADAEMLPVPTDDSAARGAEAWEALQRGLEGIHAAQRQCER
jgi:hypothetical protein